MPVYKDEKAKKNKWYFSISYKENGKYKKMLRRGFRTQKEAKAAMDEAQVALNKGTYKEPSKMLYEEFLKECLEDKRGNIKDNTLKNYQYLSSHYIVPALGAMELSKITPRDIQSLYNTIQTSGKLGDENLRKIHTIIKDSLNKAFQWDMIPKNPAALVEAPKIAKKEIQIWDHDEIREFLATAKKETRYYYAFLLALTTGMRQGEILGLRWKDIDIENKTISIVQTLSHDGKTFSIGAKTMSGNRTVTIDDKTLTELLKLRQKYKQEMMANRPFYNNEQDLVIRTSVGTRLSPRNLSRIFSSMIKKAKVKPIRFHDMRHTHASLLLKQGVNPKIVSERLGHSNVQITLNTYSHLLPNIQKETAAKFGDLFYNSNTN